MLPERIGPYNIEKKIGAGGMGNVYLGRHVETDEEAAVKELPASLAREDGFVLRFNREVEAMQKVNHSNIVKLLESGVDAGTYYYSMEYVNGETLTSRLRREKKIPWREVISLSIQICAALKHAHDAGIVHRDLKPSNLMIDQHGKVKLTDFGVAQVFATSKLTVTGGIIGTAEYMSPEQATGQRATRRSDLYSLGAVMYVMLTGRPPFTGANTMEVIQKHRFGTFDRPRTFVPEIPSWLDDIVCQLLDKDPEKRFPDAYVLSRKLQDVLKQIDRQDEPDATFALDSPLQTVESTVAATVVPNSSGAIPVTAPISTSNVSAGSPGYGQVGATLMRDLVKHEVQKSSQLGPIGQALNNNWILGGIAGLLIAVCVGIYFQTRMTPDRRFQLGVRALQEPASTDWIRAKENYFQPLLNSDPEQWRERVKPYLEQVELYELEESFTSTRKKGKFRPPQTEPERLLRLSRHYMDVGDWPQADLVLSNLRTLIEDDPQFSPLVKLTDKLTEKIQKQREEHVERGSFLDAALGRADRLMEKSSTTAARELWTSIVTLYEKDQTASDYVTRAKKRLAETAPKDE